LALNQYSTRSAMKQLFAVLCMCFLAFTPMPAQAAAAKGLPSLPKIDINLTEWNGYLHDLPDLENLTLPNISWVELNTTVHKVKIPKDTLYYLNTLDPKANLTTIGDFTRLLNGLPEAVFSTVVKTIAPGVNITKAEIVGLVGGLFDQSTPIQTLIDLFSEAQKFDWSKLTVANIGEILASIPEEYLQGNVDSVLKYVGLNLKIKTDKIVSFLKSLGQISIPEVYKLLQTALAELPSITIGEIASVLNLVPTAMLADLGNSTVSMFTTLKKYIGLVDPNMPISSLLKMFDTLKQYDLTTMTVGNLLTVIKAIQEPYLSNTINALLKSLLPGMNLTWDGLQPTLEGFGSIKISDLLNLV